VLNIRPALVTLKPKKIILKPDLLQRKFQKLLSILVSATININQKLKHSINLNHHNEVNQTDNLNKNPLFTKNLLILKKDLYKDLSLANRNLINQNSPNRANLSICLKINPPMKVKNALRLLLVSKFRNGSIINLNSSGHSKVNQSKLKRKDYNA
jgi:hypothetical protein